MKEVTFFYRMIKEKNDHMNYFTFKPPYEEDGRTVLEFNLLPGKYCTFDCIFCPVSRQQYEHHKTDGPRDFGDIADSLKELRRRIEEAKPDLVFINSLGEAFVNNKLEQVIGFIHSLGLPVRLLSNGYLYGRPEFASIAMKCEEVIGELKTVHEEAFQKAQRPLPGFTVREYIANMLAFRKKYKGRFLFEVTVVKKYSDDEASLAIFRETVKQLQPDAVTVAPMDAPFSKVLGISEDERRKFEAVLQSELAAK